MGKWDFCISVFFKIKKNPEQVDEFGKAINIFEYMILASKSVIVKETTVFTSEDHSKTLSYSK